MLIYCGLQQFNEKRPSLFMKKVLVRSARRRKAETELFFDWICLRYTTNVIN